MATFTGGETVVNITGTAGTSTSNETVYTVPAGRYAKAYLRSFVCNTSATATISISGASVTLNTGERAGPFSGGNVDAAATLEVILNTGGSISISHTGASQNASYNVGIIEYNLP